jgi:hypothetical protein
MFFIVTLLFPVFILNKIIFASIFGMMFYEMKPSNKISTISPIIVLLVFFFGFLVSIFGPVSVDRALSNQLMLSVLVLFLIYPIQKYQIDLDRIVKISGIVLVVFTGIFFLLIVTFAGNPISTLALGIFMDYASGSSGLRNFAEEASLNFAFSTVPFLYLPVCLFFYSYLKTKQKKNLIIILLFLPAIIISTSRGLWVICVLGLFLIFFLNLKLTYKLLLIGISIPIFILGVSYILANTMIFSSDEVSNNAKRLHVVSFIDNLNFMNFFIGDGLGAYYYSKGAGIMKAITEVTPVDMLRYFGFFLAPILYIFIIFPIKKLSSYTGENRIFTSIFILYLINSFTNPIMFNSYGLLIVLWYWSKILSHNNNSVLVNSTQKNMAIL